jgi:predicted nucleotidyltransferase
MALPDVRPLIRQIAERFHPKKVILFGSYAYGEPHEGSDLDLLVIVPNPPQKREAWRITAELRKQCPTPLQIVFMSPEEFEETKDVVGGLAYPAYHWGRILHEADS